MKKPYVICHMCTSIDGKILGNRWGTLPGPKQPRELFETTATALGIGAWVVGTTTLKEFCAKPFKLPAAKAKIDRTDHVVKPKAKTLAIGLDPRGQTHWKSGEVDGDHVVLLLAAKVHDDYLAHLQKAGVSYLICGDHDVDLKVAMDKLVKHFGLKKLSLQGGGKANGSFLSAGLVDEISQVIVPVADGGIGVSSIFDIGDAPKKAAAKLRLASEKKLPGGVRWVRYLVVR
jgi:2,5-diamino-6-(ribosylamino)-4(3H)-pyrimidinone 5'-phosphate reductase